MERQPRFTIVGGPNGAGKSTSAPALVKTPTPYINADEIAKGLDSANNDIEAGRILLAQWDRLSEAREDFAIETTLASKSLAPKIRRLKELGYQFHLYFFWLPDPEMAIARVAERVRAGGHNIPEDVIRRRHAAGWSNFLSIYQPIADYWEAHANLRNGTYDVVAQGKLTKVEVVHDLEIWNRITMKPISASDSIKETPAHYEPEWQIHQREVHKLIKAAVLHHKRIGNPIAEWRDGKVVIVQPEDIEVDEDDIL